MVAVGLPELIEASLVLLKEEKEELNAAIKGYDYFDPENLDSLIKTQDMIFKRIRYITLKELNK